jgi:hypothetical protein
MTSWVPPSPRAFSQRRNAVGERAVLRIADGEPEHLPVPVGGHPGGDDHRLRDDPAGDPRLAVGGIQEEVGKRRLGQGAVAEGGDFLVQVGADPRDLALGDASVGTQRPHQVVDLPGGDAVQVGLHHHGEQRLVDPPAALQQRGEERPGAQLRDPQLQIPGRRSQRAWS